jgi:NAD(P)-dependent dehydrogenase (short-subunit alcohol dehydrogenase family)
MVQSLVIGASGGIGSALVGALRAQGHTVTTISRRDDGFDITDADSVASHLEQLGPFERVIVATGALEIDGHGPEKTIRKIDAAAMAAQYHLNAIGPALVLAHAHRLLPRDRASVFAVLSARVGSIGDNRLGGWISYRAAKAGLNQVLRTCAIELARTHPKATLVALHPGTVATSFTEKYVGRHPTVPPLEAAEALLGVINGLTPDQTGQFFDYSGKEVAW